MNLTFLKTITFAFLLSMLAQIGLPFSAFAEDKIIVRWDDSSGDLIQNDKLFDAENIYPGWSDSKTVYVKNKSTTDDTDLYFKLNVKGNKKLSKELKLYVTRLGTNKSVRIGGPGDRYTLFSADEKNLFLDKLDKDSGERYRIKIKFDKNAGNELQGLSTKFDIAFTIEAVVASGQTEARILRGQGRPVPTENLTEAGAQEAEVEVLGENTPDISEGGAESDGTGIVKGTSMICKNLNKNPWLLALIALAVVLGVNGWRNSKQQGYGWKLDALAVGILIIAWYLFESCHLLRWVPISAVTIGVVLHFLLPYVVETKKEV